MKCKLVLYNYSYVNNVDMLICKHLVLDKYITLYITSVSYGLNAKSTSP